MGLVTPAILLRSVSYGEADRILTLFTEKRGKISARARGARKSWRRFGGALESFAVFEATLSQTDKRLWSLSEAELIEAHSGLASDLERIQTAALFIELIREVVPEREPEPQLFALIVELLGLLAVSECGDLPKIGLAGQLKILDAAGIGMSTERCNACGRRVPSGRKVYFNPARGGVVCTPCGGGPLVLSGEAAAVLGEFSRLPPNEISAVKLTEEVIVEISRALGVFIVQHIGKELKTDFLFNRR